MRQEYDEKEDFKLKKKPITREEMVSLVLRAQSSQKRMLVQSGLICLLAIAQLIY